MPLRNYSLSPSFDIRIIYDIIIIVVIVVIIIIKYHVTNVDQDRKVFASFLLQQITVSVSYFIVVLLVC